MDRSKNKKAKDIAKIIHKLKSCELISHLMLPVLRELETAYDNITEMNYSWENVSKKEMEELIKQMDSIVTKIKDPMFYMYGEVMKKSMYLIDSDLWIKVMELLIYDNFRTCTLPTLYRQNKNVLFSSHFLFI